MTEPDDIIFLYHRAPSAADILRNGFPSNAGDVLLGDWPLEPASGSEPSQLLVIVMPLKLVPGYDRDQCEGPPQEFSFPATIINSHATIYKIQDVPLPLLDGMPLYGEISQHLTTDQLEQLAAQSVVMRHILAEHLITLGPDPNDND